MNTYDVTIIGGGPGGYVAAIRAGQLGLKVALVEKEHLGGICLNWGCIPTKALLRTSELFSLMQEPDRFGIQLDGASFDLSKIVRRSRDVSAQLAKGVQMLLKKNKVDVFWGHGRIASPHKVLCQGDTEQLIHTNSIVISTGARARVLPGFEPDGKHIVTYKEAMVPEDMPKKLLVIGSGAIGVEFASFYHSLGSEVTIVELQNNILPAEDAEISTYAKQQFEKQGMRILTGSTATNEGVQNAQVNVTLKTPNGDLKESFDRVITAIGVVPNIEKIGLEDNNIKLDSNRLVLNQYCQTSIPNIYAIGDVASAPWLAHKASHEGIMVVDKIAGRKVKPMNFNNIPGCTYSHPQIASIGLTEQACKEQNIPIKVGRFTGIGNGKALALGDPEALVKTIFHAETGELLGAHMIGPEVTELVQGFAIAKQLEATEEDLMHTIFPHPTLSEMMHESVLDAYGKAIHK